MICFSRSTPFRNCLITAGVERVSYKRVSRGLWGKPTYDRGRKIDLTTNKTKKAKYLMPTSNWLTDNRHSLTLSLFFIQREEYSSLGVEECLNEVNRPATKAKSIADYQQNAEKNYRSATIQILTDNRHSPKLSIFGFRKIGANSHIMGIFLKADFKSSYVSVCTEIALPFSFKSFCNFLSN